MVVKIKEFHTLQNLNLFGHLFFLASGELLSKWRLCLHFKVICFFLANLYAVFMLTSLIQKKVN
jgi:hypothetical protein